MPPLAERMRPRTLNDFVGQTHLVGEGAILRRSIERGNIPSIIFWGPPGVGKTTLARIISNQLNRPFYTLSAINSGVKDIREVIEKAGKKDLFQTDAPILFIDEIHRFSKSQQDSLLGAVETGVITLIGATTENPSFEIISALLSRTQVYVLKSFGKDDLLELAEKAIKEDSVLKKTNINIKENEALLRLSGGDARKLLNILELLHSQSSGKELLITDELVISVIQQNIALYDKSGEMHFDIISAFIKSMRGSDPNAAVYWLARMLEGGEDPSFIARRMLILASEDIGNADPQSLQLANACFQAVNIIGMPEARIILSQTAIYLASAPKSNASYMAIGKAQELVKTTGDLSVPLHIRNAPTRLMKDLGYGEGYEYAHGFEGNFNVQEYLPDDVTNSRLYEPGNNEKENATRERLRKLWGEKYKF